ncbi:MAG: putative transcriptional regulator [Candidatus Petromonas sp.]|nr:putative transcriptional regulator [Candidatus Petromonas sp.]
MHIKLRNIRNKKSISATEMKDLLGLKTEAAYYKKESGMVKFSLEEARKISEKLGMKIEDIFFDNKVSKSDTNRNSA